MLKFLVFLTLAHAAMDAADAQMIAMGSVTMQSLIDTAANRGAEDRKAVLAVAETARDAFDLQSVQVPARRAPDKVEPDWVALAMRNALTAPKGFAHPVSATGVATIKKNRVALEAAFKHIAIPQGTESDVWPWFENAAGEKDKALKDLRAFFDAENDRVMKLTQAVSGLGKTPLSEAEFLYGALETLLPAAELKAYTEKLEKMKVHVSSLPQMHIMT
jgi:hypothetical protein